MLTQRDLEMALAGYQIQIDQLHQKVQEIRKELHQKNGNLQENQKKVSAEGRRRMALAQKKRWANWRKQQKNVKR